MQFSLRSRFRGAFLGAALGQVFGTIALNQAPFSGLELPALSLLNANQLWYASGTAVGAAAGAAVPQPNRSPASSIVALAQELIEPPGSPYRSPIASQPQSAIDFLPLILFCHESPAQLQSALLSRSANLPGKQQSELLAIGQIVSLMLQEQFFPDRSLPLLLAVGHGQNILSEELTEQLQQVQSWLIDQTPLAMLPPVKLSPLAAALYGLLKTPASLPIALVQTLRLAPDPEAAALVGLFLGSYQSEAGLPIDWRLAIDGYQSALLQQIWGAASGAALLNLANQLWAVWSGVYQPQRQQPVPATITAIPRLMRPR